MDLTFKVPMQYCSLQHQTTSITSRMHSWALFCFGSTLHCFWSNSSTLLQYHIGHLWAWGVDLSVPYLFLPSHTVFGVLKARILKWLAIFFSTGPRFVRTLHHDPSILDGPTRQACNFIELDKAVIQVISLVSLLWLWIPSCLPSDG